MWRHEERRGIFHGRTVPTYLAGVARQQAEQDAEQGRLARADAPGHDRELAAPQREGDVVDARASTALALRAPEVIAPSDGIEALQLLDRDAIRARCRGRARYRLLQVERRADHERRGRNIRRAAAHQREHAAHRHAELLVLREEQSEESAEPAHEAAIRDE